MAAKTIRPHPKARAGAPEPSKKEGRSGVERQLELAGTVGTLGAGSTESRAFSAPKSQPIRGASRPLGSDPPSIQIAGHRILEVFARPSHTLLTYTSSHSRTPLSHFETSLDFLGRDASDPRSQDDRRTASKAHRRSTPPLRAGRTTNSRRSSKTVRLNSLASPLPTPPYRIPSSSPPVGSSIQ